MDEKSSLTRNDLEQSMMDSDLTYLAKNSSSLVIERTTKRMYADNPSYGSDNKNLVVNFQTGVDYIDGRNSFMKINLKIDATAGVVNFGHGTVLNLIDSVKVISRSGTVLGRMERANLLQYYETKYNHSYSWFGSKQADNAVGVGIAGGMLGYDDLSTANLDDLVIEYNLPLALIHPFFDQHNLLPSMVCKGLRLEITLADAAQALVSPSGTATYELTNVWCSLDSYRLTDDAMRKLNDMSREPEGLVLQYYDWENSSFSRPVGVSSLSAEVRKTVSMANSAFAVTRLQANTTNAATDSFLAQPLENADTYQWRVGSMYMPQTALSGPKSWYSNANYCKGTLKTHSQPYVRYSHPTATVPSFTSLTAAGGCYAVACVDLDRYWLDLSGLAINNSVTLNLNVGYGNVAAAGKVDLFLKHTRRVAVYSDNLVVLE